MVSYEGLLTRLAILRIRALNDHNEKTLEINLPQHFYELLDISAQLIGILSEIKEQPVEYIGMDKEYVGRHSRGFRFRDYPSTSRGTPGRHRASIETDANQWYDDESCFTCDIEMESW